jgi:hypothetical protein
MTRRSFGSVIWREDRPAFYVRFTHQGSRIQRRVGESQIEAERVLKDIGRRIELGSSLSAILTEVFGDVTGHQLTLRDAAPLYLEYTEARKRPSTFRNDVSRLRGLLRAPWATKPLGVVSVADLTAWASRRMSGKRRVSGATVNRDLNLVSALYRWAIGMGYVESNPARSVVRASEKPCTWNRDKTRMAAGPRILMVRGSRRRPARDERASWSGISNRFEPFVPGGVGARHTGGEVVREQLVRGPPGSVTPGTSRDT